MSECKECFCQVDDSKKGRHRSWHQKIDRQIAELEAMIRRK